MNLLDNYSRELLAKSNKERAIGQKETTPPVENTIELFGYNEQYYCHLLLLVFFQIDPCFCYLF